MKKYDRISNIITVVGTIIITIILTCYNVADSPLIVASLKNDYPTQEDFNILKEYATIYAKTLDEKSIEDETIQINTSYTSDTFFVSMIAETHRVNAKCPVTLKSIEDGNFQIQILYDAMDYEEISYVHTIWGTIIDIIAIFIMLMLLTTVGTFAVSQVICLILKAIDKKKLKKNKEK